MVVAGTRHDGGRTFFDPRFLENSLKMKSELGKISSVMTKVGVSEDEKSI
jgi:hypothetical protein